MKYWITLHTGFNDDQKLDIPMQEAHKAYYLFKHPDERGVFDCGIAVIGKDIRQITPNWLKTMGWNNTHDLDNDDWNEIRHGGVEIKMRELIGKAKEVGDLLEEKPELSRMKLEKAIKLLPSKIEHEIIENGTKQLLEKFKATEV